MKSVGSDLCEALIAFEDGQFDKAVDIIYPKRYQIVNLGGSNAQVIIHFGYMNKRCGFWFVVVNSVSVYKED